VMRANSPVASLGTVMPRHATCWSGRIRVYGAWYRSASAALCGLMAVSDTSGREPPVPPRHLHADEVTTLKGSRPE
jgi:hypothetical protein